MMKRIVALGKKDISKTFYEKTKIKTFFPKDLPSKDWPESWKRIFAKDYPRLQKIELTKNIPLLKIPLSKVLLERKSERSFSGKSTDVTRVGTLLFYSSGIMPGAKHWNSTRRFYPSAGARYPLEVYLSASNVKGLKNGLYHYNVRGHSLDGLWQKEDINIIISKLTNQDWIVRSNIIILITSVFQRTQTKYGNRGLRHIFLEGGHLAQNIYLVATALGLKVCAIGGFVDDRINKIIDIDGEGEGIIYVLAVGT